MLWQVNTTMGLAVQLWNKTLTFCDFCQMSSYILAGLVNRFDSLVIHWSSHNRNTRTLKTTRHVCLFMPVWNLRPQITNLWRSGHFDSFIPFSKMQQLRAKLWRQKTLKTKRVYQPKARRHSCGNYRARGCPLWAWVLCHLGLSPNWRCSTGGGSKCES